LRSMRHWGDRSLEFGVRDTVMPAWNGRMSEIVAAVVLEQFKIYPKHLSFLRNSVKIFQAYLDDVEGLELVLGNARSIDECAFTQVVLRIDEAKLGWHKNEFKNALGANGIPVWHANFEPINSLGLFRDGLWRTWLPQDESERIAINYGNKFSAAVDVYKNIGIGLAKMNFLSNDNLHHLMRQIDKLVRSRKS
jgi:dTDP-4-amino-4,6-dideoxygalactose transaminase